MADEKHIVIVGAGFSGSLMAINLLRQQGGRVTLIERDAAKIARGTAYGTRRSEHLLNVRAGNMSAYPDDPSHFLRWIEKRGEAADQFIPRKIYGQYIGDQLAEMVRTEGERFQLIVGEVIAADRKIAEPGFSVTLADGSSLAYDTLILAQGNLPPGDMPVFAGLKPPLYHADSWGSDWLSGLSAQDHIVLIGTGLTSVDVILTLDEAGFRGKVTALSRRGLKPQAHLEKGPVVQLVDRPEGDGSHAIAHIRNRAATVGWHMAVDELRPHVQDLWRRMDRAGQGRFLRHARPYWDVHRHRIAPSVAAILERWSNEGRLEFAAGKITDVAAVQEGEPPLATIRWRVRGSEEKRAIAVSRIINCTGPHGDIRRSTDPLLGYLAQQGLIRNDVHHLGLDVDRFGGVRNVVGHVQPDLRALGPLTKGEAWEITAVPDIRRQVWDMARSLSNSHWVGGEGL
ncbi:MAG: FAD-dependent oxidoreductase [Sphingobium sp.]|nr:FAD-dependent oxidoreductase [Sphingobium sp.]